MQFNRIIFGDAKSIPLPDSCIDLIITSPPYNAKIKYDSYSDDLPLPDYLQFLNQVWKECHRVLVPSGRICVNIAGIGRKPYLPLHHFISTQLTALGLTHKAEIIWEKGASANHSTAWGSFKSARAPDTRDSHEYIEVFCKGDWKLPNSGESTLNSSEFVENTRGEWIIKTASSPEHPAVFPSEIPYRLIQQYSYKNAVVLDPFCGIGTTCIVAKQLGRQYFGIDCSLHYSTIARKQCSQTNLLQILDEIPKAEKQELHNL